MTIDDISLSLRWRKTWDDYENDFVSESPVPDVMIGRIMMTVGGPQDGLWQWTYQAAIKGLPWAELDRSGFQPTPRLAANLIKGNWFHAIQGKTFHPKHRCFVEPRYFFDIEDNEVLSVDDVGVVISDLSDVRNQAISCLPEIAKEELPTDSPICLGCLFGMRVALTFSRLL